MRISNSARFGGAMAFGAVAAVSAGVLFLTEAPALAKAAKVAKVGRVDTPLGLMGTRGAGGRVGISFSLVDESRTKTDVQVEYGYDKNGDGKITDGTEPVPAGQSAYPDEYSIATEDRLDPRDTRKNKAPQLFTTAGDIGAAQNFMWNSTADLPSNRLLTLEYKLTPQGRQVPDPDNPGSFLFATGPDGTAIFAGVKVRVRAVRSVKQGRRANKVTGDWVYSQPFALNNNNPPTMTLDTVDSNGISNPVASDENVLIHWTVFDPDSEDLNGDGVLEIPQGEDINGDGKLEAEQVGVAFDYHRVAANENPAAMTPAQLAALTWLPCTRAQGVGDTDSLDARPGITPPAYDPANPNPLAGLPSAPPGVGRKWTFAWNSVADAGTVYAKYIFRGRPFDVKREQGDFAYFKTPVQLDNWKIFNGGSASFPIASLSGPRVGQTTTRIQATVNPSANDALDRGDDNNFNGFQSVVVAGGAPSVGGGGVTDIDLMSINTVTAETSTSALIHHFLSVGRAYHSATALDDGRILFAGGFDSTGINPLSSTEIYDPKTQTVTDGPTLGVARAKHAAVKLASGDVALFGGIGAGGAVLDSCELIQFKPYADDLGAPIPTSTWTVSALPPLATRQQSPTATLLPDQMVLVTDGIDGSGAAVLSAQLLNPLNAGPNPATPQLKSPVFLTVASMLEARKYGTATSMLDGNVLFAGGTGKASLEVFNWKSRAFEPVLDSLTSTSSAMQTPRAQHVATLLGDGTVLLAGGSPDPDVASPTVTADADVVRITSSGPGTWTSTSQNVNGDLSTGRRLAKAAVIDNGRVFITGGSTATAVTASVETYTPANGVNFAPKARTILPSSQQSWLYGAPIYYRLTDAEQDHAKVQIQFIDRSATGDKIWHACSPQPDTIGGDVAESTADLVTVLTDDLSLVIDPVVHNTVADHAYIWAISQDVPRPALGKSVGPFNVRVIPYGAIRGLAGESIPLTVLYNTRVLPTLLPPENYADNRPDLGKPAGTLTAVQAGDIRLWVHLRDLDGGAAHTNGDPASCLYEYAIDKNNDGQIKSDDAEGFVKCTASGAAVGHPSSSNPQTGLTTYFDPYTASDPQFGARPASKGWTFFDWDSVRDLGTPVTSFNNIWIRITPSDADPGFVRVERNIAGQPPVLTIVRHPDAVWLASWRPRYSNNKALTPVNDPIDVTFNGQVEPGSVNATSFQVYRGITGSTASVVRGQYAVTNNSNNTATVTFFPDPQSTSNGAVVYGQTAASTVLFPNDDYSFRIPGYDPAVNVDPQSGTTIRPLGQTVLGGQYSTFRLIQSPPINLAGTDANYRFHTAAPGVYADDGGSVANVLQSPAPGTTTPILRNQGVSGSPITFTFNRGLDPNTVASPNITATLTQAVKIAGVTQPARVSVVPGRWTVTNAQTSNGTSVSSSATAAFTPLFQLPPDSTVHFATNAGLKAFNGHSVPNGTFDYLVEHYTGVNNNVTLETFSNANQNDTTITNAAWGTDGCVPGALTGGSSGINVGGAPTGGSGALTVASGSTVTLTQAVNDYSSITVNKGGTLVIASTAGACTIRSTGNITISGTVTFKGQDGVHGVHGNVSYPYMYAGPQYPNTTPGGYARAGGIGKNGGGSGGASTSCASTDTSGTSIGRRLGGDGSPATGTTTTYGQGGQIPTETASTATLRYGYGAGGGAGGGSAFAGLAGGRPMTYYTASAGYGAASTPGAAYNDGVLSSGMTGGGGGGGGATCSFYPGQYVYGWFEGGGGGAGAGAVTFYTNGVFTLSATGLIDGRGGNGGQSSHFCGSGGAGAGGTLRIVSLGGATNAPAALDGVIDLRGGRGGAKGYAGMDFLFYYNATSEKTPRYGGDGSPGRLMVLAPNYGAADEVRVYGQMYLKPLASLPTTGVASTSPPSSVFTGSAFSTTYNYGSTSVMHWNQLNIASGAVVDLIGTVPLQLFVDNSATIAGTLRINGNSTTSSSTATGGTLVQNFNGQATFPNGAYMASGSAPPGNLSAGTTVYPGMAGNGGGGNGGAGDGGSNAGGREGTNGTGPQNSAGVHNMNPNTGWYSSYYFYSGDSGGTGASNATDGEDGWAVYAQAAGYNYLGAFTDWSGSSGGTGAISTSGRSATFSNTAGTPNFPIRIGLAATDPTAMVITNLASFVGAGGGGGNEGGDTYPYSGNSDTAIGAIGGGGGGAIGIVSPSVTVTGEIDARGGDGQTPGAAYYWYAWAYAHSGGGGGSGGTVYIAGNTVSIGPVSSSGTGGATFDLRGGLGGGWRSQNQSAGLQAYPEYMSTGAFGGSGGFGRLVVAYTNAATLNSGHFLDNRWGIETTGIDTSSNTYKTLGGTARFICPGLVPTPIPATARSKWYDLKSLSPALTGFTLGTAANATYTLRVEGAQSLPNSPGSPAGTWGAGYTANTGDPDPGNTSGLFVPSGSPILQGFRFLRWDLSFTRTTPAIGAPVQFDNISAVYSSDL